MALLADLQQIPAVDIGVQVDQRDLGFFPVRPIEKNRMRGAKLLQIDNALRPLRLIGLRLASLTAQVGSAGPGRPPSTSRAVRRAKMQTRALPAELAAFDDAAFHSFQFCRMRCGDRNEAFCIHGVPGACGCSHSLSRLKIDSGRVRISRMMGDQNHGR